MKTLNLIKNSHEDRKLCLEKIFKLDNYQLEIELKKYGFKSTNNRYKNEMNLFLSRINDRGPNVRYMLSVPSKCLIKNCSLKTLVCYLRKYQWGSVLTTSDNIIVSGERAMIHWWIENE